MRVLTVSWEYPPVLVGGLGRHVDALTRALAAAGHDVRVVTRGSADAAPSDQRDGVTVVRSRPDPLRLDFTTESLLAWSMANEHALLRAALPLVERWRPDVVHAHDWLVAQSSITLRQHLGVPLVATVHATEAGRHQGWLPAPLNRAVHSLDAWLARSADAVIACSSTTAADVRDQLGVEPDRVTVVPNGIDPMSLRTTPTAVAGLRAALAADGAPVIGFAGRLVHEKGVQDLLAALPALRRRTGAVLAVAGSGPYAGDLHAEARRRRLGRAVHWLGFLDDLTLAAFYRSVDVLVVPSHYEPFGIVALEAAAVGTPVVVARTGGLCDLAAAGLGAASFTAGDVSGLAAAVETVLADPERTRRTARRARRLARRDYTWSAVAGQTAAVYERVTGS